MGLSPGKQPIIRIQAPSQPLGFRDVAFTGLGNIIQAWREEDPLILTGSSGYAGFYVSRNGIELGSLWNIRQKWQLWREEQDAWAAQMGHPRRQRRASKTEKNNGYSYVKGRLTQTTNDGIGPGSSGDNTLFPW